MPAVRDSFAVLQATYNDGCTTAGNCEYFLTRVLTNLDELYNSMKADPKGSQGGDPMKAGGENAGSEGKGGGQEGEPKEGG